MLIYNYIMLISTYHRHAFRAQNWVATIRKGRREHFVHLADGHHEVEEVQDGDDVDEVEDDDEQEEDKAHSLHCPKA